MIGGDDPLHDLPWEEKERLESEFRKKARGLPVKEGKRLNRRADEISRRKSKRAHQGTD